MFTEHELYKLISDDIIKIAKISLDESKKEDGKWILDQRLWFVWGLYSPLIEIESKIQDLEKALLFIKHPIYDITFKEKLTQHDYIKYHLEYYLICQISVFDRLLHLVNFIYELGLSDLYVKYDRIVKNYRVDEKIKSVLKNFDTYLSDELKVRKLQNNIKHKESLRVVEMNDPWTFEFSANLSNTSEKDKKMFLTAAVKEYESFLKQKTKDIQKEILKITSFIEESLDIFYPIVKKRYEDKNF